MEALHAHCKQSKASKNVLSMTLRLADKALSPKTARPLLRKSHSVGLVERKPEVCATV